MSLSVHSYTLLRVFVFVRPLPNEQRVKIWYDELVNYNKIKLP